MSDPVIQDYNSLAAAIKMGITAYSSAVGRNAKTSLVEIAVAASDLQTAALTTLEQYRTFEDTLEHLAISWNNTSKSMSLYMEELDKKTLQLSQPGSTQRKVNAPSTSSVHSPDPRIGATLQLHANSQYVSEYGCLSVDVDENVGFIATTALGITLAKLIGVINKPRVLEQILDRDLSEIICYINSNTEMLDKYPTWSQAERKRALHTLGDKAHIRLGQWAKKGDA